MEKIIFKSSDGLSLRGEILQPEGSLLGMVVLAHPHPLYGGDMNNSVIDILWRSLPQVGLLTFRFNFRGVGTSEGYFEEGIGETHDITGAIQFLKDSGHHVPCFAIGYSFGAYVIHLLDKIPPLVKGIVMISPPVSMISFDHSQFSEVPTLFVCGDHDAYCRHEPLKGFVTSLKGENTLRVIPGTDHFWIGREETLLETVQPWILSRLNASS